MSNITAGKVIQVIESPKKDKNGATYYIVQALEHGGAIRRTNSFIKEEFNVGDSVWISPNGEYFNFVNAKAITKELVNDVKDAAKELKEMWS